MDSGIWDQVGLEFGDIDIEGTVESEGSSEGRDDLGDKSVKIGVGGSFDVEVSSADVIDSFVVEHDSDVGVLQEGVGGEDGVVGFNDSGGNLGRGVDGETEFGFLTVIDGKSFQKEGSESGTSSSSDGVENEESLETSAVVSELSDSVQTEIDDFFTNGVMTSGEVIGGIFLSGDELFGMEQLSVSTSSNFIDNSWFEINEN